MLTLRHIGPNGYTVREDGQCIGRIRLDDRFLLWTVTVMLRVYLNSATSSSDHAIRIVMRRAEKEDRAAWLACESLTTVAVSLGKRPIEVADSLLTLHLK
ncbi:hypothetical protein ACWAUC_15235 [Bradyrhizobium guangdongense]